MSDRRVVHACPRLLNDSDGTNDLELEEELESIDTSECLQDRLRMSDRLVVPRHRIVDIVWMVYCCRIMETTSIGYIMEDMRRVLHRQFGITIEFQGMGEEQYENWLDDEILSELIIQYLSTYGLPRVEITFSQFPVDFTVRLLLFRMVLVSGFTIPDAVNLIRILASLEIHILSPEEDLNDFEFAESFNNASILASNLNQCISYLNETGNGRSDRIFTTLVNATCVCQRCFSNNRGL